LGDRRGNYEGLYEKKCDRSMGKENEVPPSRTGYFELFGEKKKGRTKKKKQRGQRVWGKILRTGEKREYQHALIPRLVGRYAFLGKNVTNSGEERGNLQESTLEGLRKENYQ